MKRHPPYPPHAVLLQIVASHPAGDVAVVARRYARPMRDLEVLDNLRKYPIAPIRKDVEVQR